MSFMAQKTQRLYTTSLKIATFVAYRFFLLEMNILLVDGDGRNGLLPFTYTKTMADIRCGIWTARERWGRLSGEGAIGSLTVPYLQDAFPSCFSEDNLYISGDIVADRELAIEVLGLGTGSALVDREGRFIALRAPQAFQDASALQTALPAFVQKESANEVVRLAHLWDIFHYNAKALSADFEWTVEGRRGAPLPEHVMASGRDRIFIEEGAVVRPCVMNAEAGPIYIGKDAEVMEGCLIRGGLALGEGAVLKMGAKVYGATSIGPGCKVGGEVSNVVFAANSNKGHDGFLGNAVIGEWCNLGADTNCSNLKNNYGPVQVWNDAQKVYEDSGLQFCGLFMGDHSKCGINTMFNTGTVVGVSCNVFGTGFPSKHVPNFSWGGSDGLEPFVLEKALEVANRMMERRGRALSDPETAIFRYLSSMQANMPIQEA